MDKVCVFCGKQPVSKTNEHVLPQWLIELTGNPKRLAHFGLDFNKVKPEQRSYSFDSFKFPACNFCNATFSELESLANPIMSKMLSNEAISASEIITLLDWFDKVRIGLWLAYYYLDKNPAGIEPNFYIAQRIRLYDRMVLICRADTASKMLSFVGCDSPIFSLLPSCFCLVVNHLVFLNISYHFLFSRRFGFPYPKASYLQPKGNNTVEMKFVHGRQRIMRPLLKKPFSLQGTELYQPIFPSPDKDASIYKLYNNAYVKEHSLDWERGLGKVYYKKGEGYSVYPDDYVFQWIPKEKYLLYELCFQAQLMTFEWQLELEKISPSLANLNDNERREQRELRQIGTLYNKKLINILIQKSKEANISPAWPI